MNWDALGAAAEFIATVTVIATLLYLSRQVKQAATESRLSAVHDLSKSYTDWIHSIAASAELSSIWDRGLTDID